MTFDLSDDQALIKATVERFVGPGDVETLRRARACPGGVDPARWARLAELGLLALPAAEAAGGLGGDRVTLAVVAEALGRGVAPDPWLESACLPLALAGAAPPAAAIARGDVRAALAFAEPGRRFRLDPVDTRAEGDRLTGAKTFVLAGGGAGLFLVTAAGPDGPALWAVEPGAATVRPYRLVDGGIAAELALRGAPATRVAALDDLEPRIADLRLIAAAEMLGLAGRLFDETLAYVRQREQFGQPLGRFQAIQHRLVDCYARLEQMRSMLWRGLLDRAPAGRPARAAGVKAFVAEGALMIGHEAIQLHGGMGVTDELIVGHAHKRILLLSKLFEDPAAGLAAYAEAA